jgi:hypothetical protein
MRMAEEAREPEPAPLNPAPRSTEWLAAQENRPFFRRTAVGIEHKRSRT